MAGRRKFGMMGGCQEPAKRVAWSMRTLSAVFVLEPRCRDCSAIRWRGWSLWFGGKKAICGTVHRGWYDRTRRQVRDLPCGPYGIYLNWRCGGSTAVSAAG